MDTGEIKRRIAEVTYRILSWGQNRVPPGVRSVIGVIFMVAGVFGFLPILGFWMLPLGIAFVALDVPPARRKTDAWIERLRLQAGLEAK
ncbi:MAG: hypothetical protein O7F71_08145 [Gammaproteobacteria bacterium]|nr:hypothetical protein [Gammaproteobacteria bacterium]